MASKRGGKIPPYMTCADANQALAVLENVHHWACTRVNRNRDKGGVAHGYNMTITHAGRRVSVCRLMFVECVNAAMQKLAAGDAPKLRLVGNFNGESKC